MITEHGSKRYAEIVADLDPCRCITCVGYERFTAPRTAGCGRCSGRGVIPTDDERDSYRSCPSCMGSGRRSLEKEEEGGKMNTDDKNFHTETFKKMKFGVSRAVPNHIARQLDYQQYQDMLLDSTIYQIEGFIAGKQSKEVLEVPKTWWDHFKVRWFPEWALDKWPPEMQKYRAEAYLPNIHLPENQMEGLFYHWKREYDW